MLPACCFNAVPYAASNTCQACSGQTGSGKTYTMLADQSMTLADALNPPSNSSSHGIVPRAVHELFKAIEQRRSATRDSKASTAATAAAAAAAGEAKLVLSYLEIYNDRLYYLLQPYKPGSSR
jgi:hypothetical protein